MNETQAREFFRDACNYLPGLSRFVQQTPDGGAAIFNAWMRVFKEIELEHASEVIIQISVGDIELPDYWTWQDFPKVLRRHCDKMKWRLSKEAREAAASNKTAKYACEHCQDSGFVRIYHPGFTRSIALNHSLQDRFRAMEQMDYKLTREEFNKFRQPQMKNRSMTYMATCICDEGERHAENNPEITRFEEGRTPVCRTGAPKEIVDWLDGRKAVEFNAEDWG